MKRYLKCFFKLITWKDESGPRSCYAYSTTPGYTCSASAGGTNYTMNVSVRSSSSEQTSDEEYTSWLSDSDGKALPEEQALQMKAVYGDVAYFAVHENGSKTLTPASDFKGLPVDEQNLVTSLHLQA